MNYSDTERVCSVLESVNLEEVEDTLKADIAILTTCSVKQKAEDKVFSFIHNFSKARKKDGVDRKIFLTGCMVKTSSTQESEKKDPLLHRIPELDGVFRIEDILRLPQLLNIGTSIEKNSYLDILPKYKSAFQAFVPIQTGCDNFCTFCIVPFTRGRERSRRMEEIIKEITFLAKKGLKEVTLVGQNVNSYGKGLSENKRKFDEEHSKWMDGNEKTPFTLLLEKVSNIEGLERIRFQSSNPHDMTDDMIQSICTLPKVMPHLHFALQSANDNVLKRMNRKHRYIEYKNIVEKIRKQRPDFSITTDIIVGFCGETEKEFQDSLRIFEDIKPDLVYISQYSPRKGTASEKAMRDDVPQDIKKQRWHIMNDLLKKQVKEKMQSLIGSQQRVLIEKLTDDIAEGKTEHNYVCQIEAKNIKVGDIVEVEITGSSQWALNGRVLLK